MLGPLNHVAIAVPDIKAAAETYRKKFNAKVSEAVPQPDHGVTTVFVDLGNTKIELLEPLGEDSPIAGFLAKNPKGGQHHICFEVESVAEAIEDAKSEGAAIIGEPRIGAHGTLMIFIHPKNSNGCLIELMEPVRGAH